MYVNIYVSIVGEKEQKKEESKKQKNYNTKL